MKKLTSVSSRFTGISSINKTLSVAALDVIYWTPQVVGASGFVIAALLGLYESQRRWYIPDIADISWLIPFFNLIGGMGFMLCGVRLSDDFMLCCCWRCFLVGLAGFDGL